MVQWFPVDLVQQVQQVITRLLRLIFEHISMTCNVSLGKPSYPAILRGVTFYSMTDMEGYCHQL